MSLPALGFLRVKVIALATRDFDRAHRFYADTLGLAPAFEGERQVGYRLGTTIFMLKEPDWDTPTVQPNPRITLATEEARATETALRGRGIAISDPVERYGEFLVGSFLDSEGNKLWFCSPA